MNKKNLVGLVFGKLTVISSAFNLEAKNKGRSFTAWNCRCECGKIIIVRTGTLTSNQQKSCGCIIENNGMAIKAGQQFNRLITISYNKGYWDCLCECGEKTTVLTHHLISNNTKSCGCLKKEKILINQKISLITNTKYSKTIAAARKVWRSYNKRDCKLSFDDWFSLTQLPCHYCGIEKYNNYKGFLYNGLDRIDSKLGYLINNINTCCFICNRAKKQRSEIDFNKYIESLGKYNFNFNLLELPKNYLLVSIKIAYKYYTKNYGKMEIDLPTFYTYSQLPCYYCGIEKSNMCNVYLKDKRASQKAKDEAYFYYNGIDRIDNLQGHTIDNCIPCCQWCNFGKSKLSLLDFYIWIKRVQDFQRNKINKI
jgi:hypothetical protein